MVIVHTSTVKSFSQLRIVYREKYGLALITHVESHLHIACLSPQPDRQERPSGERYHAGLPRPIPNKLWELLRKNNRLLQDVYVRPRQFAGELT